MAENPCSRELASEPLASELLETGNVSALPKQPTTVNVGPSEATLRSSSSMLSAKFKAQASIRAKETHVGKISIETDKSGTRKPKAIDPKGQRSHNRGRSKGRSMHTPFHSPLKIAGTSTNQQVVAMTENDQNSNKGKPSIKNYPHDTKTQSTQRSWVAVARSAEKRYGLSFIPPTIVDGKPLVQISEAILEDSNPKWKECLVGYFVGKKLPFMLTETTVKNVWGNNLVDVMANGDGFFFFHIPDESFRRKVLDGGPITILRVPMILKQWHPNLKLIKDQHQSIPIWVKLRDIPYALWSAFGISTIANALGKPLHVDSQTEKMRMLSYARVCIEIKASQIMLDSVDVKLNDEIWLVKVEYEWRPISCISCGTFGHRCPTPNSENTTSEKNVPHPSAPIAPSPPMEELWQMVNKRKVVEKSRSMLGTPNADQSTIEAGGSTRPHAPRMSPSLSKVDASGPSAPTKSPRRDSSTSSNSGESNEDMASDMSSDTDSPTLGQIASRHKASLRKGSCFVNHDTCQELSGVRPPNMEGAPLCTGKDVGQAILPAPKVADSAPVSKPTLNKQATSRSRRRGSTKKQ
ncbi:hypothetical protein NL676_017312 [Syzygium grande]|nr:hypothetical protein NL676_017312 [Syzygium grande]